MKTSCRNNWQIQLKCFLLKFLAQITKSIGCFSLSDSCLSRSHQVQIVGVHGWQRRSRRTLPRICCHATHSGCLCSANSRGWMTATSCSRSWKSSILGMTRWRRSLLSLHLFPRETDFFVAGVVDQINIDAGLPASDEQWRADFFVGEGPHEMGAVLHLLRRNLPYQVRESVRQQPNILTVIILRSGVPRP